MKKLHKLNSTPIILVLSFIVLLMTGEYIKTHFNYNNIFTKLETNNSKITKNNNDLKDFSMGELPTNAKNTNVENIKVYPGGFPVGIKMNTKGVLVVGFSDIEVAQDKIESPGKKSGMELGDVILKVNNEDILDSKDLIKKVDKSKQNIEITIQRGDKIFNKTINPVVSTLDNSKKMGLWVRDSTAGVGTMTFYYEKNNVYGALGHPITDADTNSILKVRSGELVDSSIIAVKKGEKGSPGELKGIFIDNEKSKGTILNNTFAGIYGKLNGENKFAFRSGQLSVLPRDKVKEGKAQILTTIDENGPTLYDVEIVKLFHQDAPDIKSMVIKVTDERLLNKTGGIVQGMSGSPIIQDNCIVGAVTHVLVNRSDVGYGIYIEWMLNEAETVK